jgi:hypothetical protein
MNYVPPSLDELLRTFLLRGIFQPLPGDGHTSTLDLIIFSYRSLWSSFLTL